MRYNGTTWSTLASGSTANFLAVWGLDTNNIWAVGESGAMVKGNYELPLCTYMDLRVVMSHQLPASPT